MFKEVLKKAGVPILIGVLLLGGAGILVNHALASSPAKSMINQESKAQSTDNKSSAIPGQHDNDLDEDNDVNDAKKDAAMAAKAKISQQQAESAALAAYQGYSVKSVELDNENGHLVYEVELTDRNGAEVEVNVDADNAKILAVEHEKKKADLEDNDRSDCHDSNSEDDNHNIED